MFVALTHEIVAGFYGEPSKRTMRGFAYLEDGKPQAMFGVYYDKDRFVCFCEMRPEFRRRLGEWRVRRAMVAGVARARALLVSLKAPVHALADPDVEASGRFLEYVGFEHVREGIYAWRR